MQTVPAAAPSGKKALIISWSTDALVIENHVAAVAAGLAYHGYTVSVANYKSKDDCKAIWKARKSFSLCIAVGSPALKAAYMRLKLYKWLKAPYYFWALDPVFYDLKNIAATRIYMQATKSNPRLGYLCPEQHTLALIRTTFSQRVCHFPFAGFYQPVENATPATSRQAIAVFGNLGAELTAVNEPTLLDVIKTYNPFDAPQDKLQDFCAKLQTRGEPSNVATLVQQEFAVPAARLFDNDVVTFICQVDAFEKRRRRLNIVSQFKNHEVHFYGTGWAGKFPDCPKFQYMAPVRHTELFGLMQRYRCVLNFDPNWDGSLHDRVFTALGAGCRVITNDSYALNPDWIAKGHVMTYDMNTASLNGALDDFCARPALTAAESALYRDQENWTQRVGSFLTASGLALHEKQHG